MRQSAILCLVILLIGVQCTSISDKYPVLKSRKSLLSMMTSIESKVAVKAPVQEIVKLISDFTNQIHAEQNGQNQLYEKQTKECDDEFHFRQNEITAATDASNKASFALDACTAQHKRADSDLANVSNQISETENYLTQLIATREQEADAFHRSTESYTFNSQAADEAIDILQQIWSGEASFLQLAKHANKMLIHAISIKKVHKLTPVMAALAQVATKKLIADDVLLNNVMNLLRDFRTNIEADYIQLEASEQAAIELYNANRSRTEDFLASLVQSKADLEVEVSKLNHCISNQSSILSTASAKLQRNSALLESAQNMCSSFSKEYESATQARNQELELIAIITQKFEARYGQLSDLVKKRSEQDEFDAHQNDSQYQNAEFKHKQANYNSAGASSNGYERDTNLENLF